MENEDYRIMMNILHLSDLHRTYQDRTPISVPSVDLSVVDCVVITGDIFEGCLVYGSGMSVACEIENPYKLLRRHVFRDLPEDSPIVCVLGNHEFFTCSVEYVLNKYKHFQDDQYNVHYLDVCGSFEYGGYNFVGNVFWYDGSMFPVHTPQSVIDSYNNKSWRDYLIHDFDWSAENERCKKQIEENKSTSCSNVLVTHCVPSHCLNRWPEGVFNGFSGCADYLQEHAGEFTHAFCGHTHLPMVESIHGTFCSNQCFQSQICHGFFQFD